MGVRSFALARASTGELLATASMLVADRYYHDTHLAGGLHISSGEVVVLTGLVTTDGNVHVDDGGRLILRPPTSGGQTRLRFVGVDESRFVGGHVHHPLPSDVGLWVTGSGVLDAQGTPKTPWTRATTTLQPGATLIQVEDATGWQPGDLLAITPTIPPTPYVDGRQHQDVLHALAYDLRRVEAIQGNTVAVQPLTHPHPAVLVELADGTRRRYGAEVLNLTRDVAIEGLPDARAHVVFLEATRPQHLRHVELCHLGPRRPAPGGKHEGVLGRYALHFHHCRDGSRGSLIEGVVAHHIGSKAFVPHESHGITFRCCVAHDVQGPGWWWDQPERGEKVDQTHDSLWEECVASRSWAAEKAVEGYRLAGFVLLQGRPESNVIRGCVAVGVVNGDRAVMSSATTAGALWAERPRDIWVTDGLVCHNNAGSGVLSWQNTEDVHVLSGIVTYHNGRYGIEHGAYQNNWVYQDGACVGDRLGGLGIHAVSRRTNHTPRPYPFLIFRRFVIDGRGITRWGIDSPSHRFPAALDRDGPTLLIGCRVTGCRASHHEADMDHASWLRFLDCELQEPAHFIEAGASPATLVEVRPRAGAPYRVLHRSLVGEGEWRSDWNAVRVPAGLADESVP